LFFTFIEISFIAERPATSAIYSVYMNRFSWVDGICWSLYW